MGFIENIKIDDNVYSVLLRLLKNKTGINFEFYRKNFIEKRIKSRLIRIPCKNLEDYYDYLFSHEEEIKKFSDGFTINYTHFFRDWEVYKTFQDLFLACLNKKPEEFTQFIKPSFTKLEKFRSEDNYKKNQAKKKNSNKELDPFALNVLTILSPLSIFRKIKAPQTSNNKINIWSAPCASGEEPYTIAMILDNLEHMIHNFPNYRIIASDIDKDAIIKAKSGIYEEMTMKEIPEYFKNKYFKKKETHFGFKYSINEEIKNNVEFIDEDLTKGCLKPFKYDIVFCRYLLIYFNRNNRDKFLKNIENQLNIGGLLILGKTETLFNNHPVLRLVDEKNHIYIKSY
ncbi:MAG: CheR family methyltransferase [Promethearchaeota archaeon]